jgi:hypothetical protein
MITSRIEILQPRLTQFGSMTHNGGGDGGIGQRSHTPVLQVGVALDEYPLQRSLHVVHRGPAPLHSLQQRGFCLSFAVFRRGKDCIKATYLLCTDVDLFPQVA